MNGFVSSPPAPVSPEGSTVGADGWFPDVDVNSVRSAIRIGEGVCTHERLVAAIERAMLTAFRLLSGWRSAQVIAGALTLEDVPNIDTVTGLNRDLNGRPETVALWEHIIRYLAGADVYDLHRDISATDQGNLRAEDRVSTADDLRRMGHNSISDLASINVEVKVQRNVVELL